ncbi:MAG: hypothetical protein EZS28_046450, partial [Streblomastix strix]
MISDPKDGNVVSEGPEFCSSECFLWTVIMFAGPSIPYAGRIARRSVTTQSY